MNAHGIVEIVLTFAVLLGLARPLGGFMARVYDGRPSFLDRILGPVERGIYKMMGIDPASEMHWQDYAFAVLVFAAFGFAALYVVLRMQHHLPWNPAHVGPISPALAFNTAVSFTTNTNWQAYSGEAALSYFSQMVGLTVQNFVSAAAGMAVLVALIRGLTRKNAETIGNFWVDLVRTTLYILLPLSVIVAVLLASQGVVQSLGAYLTAPAIDGPAGAAAQTIPLGPAASQIAIKQLGTNGGGFFGVNSAHPFENPTPLSNFVEVISILLIPAALCFTYGRMIGDRRQGRALLVTMTVVLAIFVIGCTLAESHGDRRITSMGVDATSTEKAPGGAMEGKELRFGPVGSAVWATFTTAASNGSVNSMHDSFTPMGGLGPLVLMQLGEVIFGGVGSGLYGMLLFVFVAVFTAGLMVGRTPEYLGKKIEPFEMKMASIAILLPCAATLLTAAVGVLWPGAAASAGNPGPHGFSQILYAAASASNNNGSAFAGLAADTPFWNTTLGIAMLFGRFGVIVPTLAIAGAMAKKKISPASSGTLPTHTPLFGVLLAAVVLIVGALTYLPSLALGPIAEHLAWMK